MISNWLVGAAAALLLASVPVRLPAVAVAVEVLKPTGALPAALVQEIENARGYVETNTGEALVLDAGTQSVFAFNAARSSARRVISIGAEPGHILRPSGFRPRAERHPGHCRFTGRLRASAVLQRGRAGHQQLLSAEST